MKICFEYYFQLKLEEYDIVLGAFLENELHWCLLVIIICMFVYSGSNCFIITMTILGNKGFQAVFPKQSEIVHLNPMGELRDTSVKILENWR